MAAMLGEGAQVTMLRFASASSFFPADVHGLSIEIETMLKVDDFGQVKTLFQLEWHQF